MEALCTLLQIALSIPLQHLRNFYYNVIEFRGTVFRAQRLVVFVGCRCTKLSRFYKRYFLRQISTLQSRHQVDSF
jgi:hypothetical protein